MSTADMLTLPYAQRRMIVLTDRSPAEPTRSVWSRAARTALTTFSPLAGIAVEVFIEARAKMREAGEDIRAVPWTETEALQFPVGHPRKNVVYIGHPVEPPVYFPVADFHRFLFEHKVAEAQRLTRCLGAVGLEVIRVEGWDQSVGVSAGLDVVNASLKTLVGKTGLEIGGNFVEHRNTIWRLQGTFSPAPETV